MQPPDNAPICAFRPLQRARLSSKSRLFEPAAWAVALVALAWGGASAAQERDPARPDTRCLFHNWRWQEDCRGLSDQEMRGLEALRYRPLDAEGDVWLTVGGEARVRMDMLRDIDFGIGGQPGYLMTAGRLLLNGDLRSKGDLGKDGPRAFVQLGIVEENGRKPGPRGQDESQVDVTQAFIDAPFTVGGTRETLRFGRQEIDLSGNRLLSTRDGAVLRRAFQGAKLDIEAAGSRTTIVAVRPVELRADAFDDRADPKERFTAVSVDLPPALTPGNSNLNLFVFDRSRSAGLSYLRAAPPERRYTAGLHYAGAVRGWTTDVQAAWQSGHVQGRPIRAYGFAVTADRPLPWRGLTLNLDLMGASGDRAGSNAIETFDPVYPTNGGLTDSPIFYQTNYIYGGGGVSGRWRRIAWSLSSNLMARASVDDALYANSRPIAAAYGRERMTAVMSQLAARRQWGDHYEVYLSAARSTALAGVTEVGGKDATYIRLQLTSRF